MVNDDIMGFFEEFNSTAVLSKVISAYYFLALIPKRDHPQGLRDYRPNFLSECIYKTLAKLLTNRLKKVLHGVISPCQSSFL